MNEDLNIKVTVPGVTTIGQLADELKKAKIELKGMALASQEAANQKSKIEALTKAYRNHTHISSEFSKLIREERMEQRQTNFALREGIGALAAMGLQGKVLNDVLGGIVSSFSGVSFALKALSPSLAGIATPVGIAAAAFFLFNQIMKDSKKLTEDINDGLTEQARLLKEAGLATGELLRKRLQLDLITAQKKQAEAGTGISWEGFVGAISGGKEGVEKARHKQRIDAYNEVLKIVGQIKKLDDEDSAERQKSLDLALDTEKKLKSLKQEVEKDKKESTKKGIDEEQKRYEREFGQTGTLQANLGNISPIGRPGSKAISQPLSFGGNQASPLTIAAAQFRSEMNDTVSVISDFKNAMWNTTDSLTQSFTGLITGTMSLSQSFTSFGESIIQMMAQMAASEAAKTVIGGIMSIFGLASGGDVVASGNALQFAATGGSYKYGKTQNVVVGELGPELMQVGKNGVRVIPNINRSGQSGRFGGGDSYEVRVHPIIDNQGLAMQVIIGNNQRNKRIMRSK